jgi:hypothetical protein
MGAQDSVADVQIWPQPVEQLLFRDQALRVLGEVAQDRKGLRLESDGLRMEPQLFVAQIEMKGWKYQAVVITARAVLVSFAG